MCWTVWTSQRQAPGSDRDEATDRRELAALFPAAPRVSGDEGAAAYHAWERGTTTVASDHELFNLVIKRSVSDLRLLVNDGPGPGERYIAAGVPWFATLFGRDALITAFQSLAFRPQIAVETLEVLAAYQATEDDPWRDAEPGKILHELRTGEMARAGELPHTPYYGSVDSTPLWLILLGATFDWTGDRALVDRLWPNALAALEWIDRTATATATGSSSTSGGRSAGCSTRAGRTRSDAIRDRTGPQAAAADRPGRGPGLRLRRQAADGRPRPGARRGGPGGAARRARPRRCAARFEAAFWVEDQRYYAMALDGDKRQADAIALQRRALPVERASSAPERARDVVDQLLRPAMFSGWGIRTYAAGQPGFNPIGYHTGTVWPHDTSLIAAGLQALRLRRRLEPAGRPDAGGGPALPRLPPAGAVLRLRPGGLAHAGALPGRLLAAGLGGRRVVPVPRRRCSGCGRTPTAASSSCPTRTCPTGSARSR